MKRILLSILATTLICPSLWAGFTLPQRGANRGSIADGAPLGQPERPNPNYNPEQPDGPGNRRTLEEDPIDRDTRTKMQQHLAAKHEQKAKLKLGCAEWDAFTEDARTRLVDEIGFCDHRVKLLDRRVVLVAEPEVLAIRLGKRLVVVVTHPGDVMNHLSNRDDMPVVHQVGQVGMYIRVQVETPSKLTSEQRELVEKLAESFGKTVSKKKGFFSR